MRSAWKVILGYFALGVLFALGFWLLEAVLHSVWFEPDSFVSDLWPQSFDELWMRIFTAGLFVVFGVILGLLALRLSAQRDRLLLNRRAFDELRECVLITDYDNRIIYVNRAYTQITGYRVDEVMGKNPSISGSGKQNVSFYQEMWQQLQSQGHWQGEMWNRKKTGELYPEWLSITALRSGHGEIEYYIGVFSDITVRKKTDDLMRHYALYDALTDLPNRRFFHERVEQAMRYAKRNQQQLAIMFLDMDRFKLINDKYGHDVGDQYLQEFTRSIQAVLRDVDTLSRFGGDEFVVLLTGLNDKDSARSVAEKILTIDSVLVNDIKMPVSCSIGVAMYPEDGLETATLIERADKCMYQAKQHGRHAVNFVS